MERFEGNNALAFTFALTGVLLLAFVGVVLVLAAPQCARFSLLEGACGIFWLSALSAGGLYLLSNAREASARFAIDGGGITRHAWGRSITLAWRAIVHADEYSAADPKIGVSGRCVLHGAGGERLVIPFPFVANSGRLHARLEPHLAALRVRTLKDLAEHGGRFRPTRTLGVLLWACIAPMILLAGLAAFDPGATRYSQPTGWRFLGFLALGAAPVVALWGIELFSRTLEISREGIRLRSCFVKRQIPFARIESITVKVVDVDPPDIHRATIRSDDGQTVAFTSRMPAYRAVLDLICARTGLTPHAARPKPVHGMWDPELDSASHA